MTETRPDRGTDVAECLRDMRNTRTKRDRNQWKGIWQGQIRVGQGQMSSTEEHGRSQRGKYIYWKERQKTKRGRWGRVMPKAGKRGKG